MKRGYVTVHSYSSIALTESKIRRDVRGDGTHDTWDPDHEGRGTAGERRIPSEDTGALLEEVAERSGTHSLTANTAERPCSMHCSRKLILTASQTIEEAKGPGFAVGEKY